MFSSTILWAGIFLGLIGLMKFRKKPISLKDIQNADWKLRPSAVINLSNPKVIMLSNDGLKMVFIYRDTHEEIVIKSKNRCSAIRVYFVDNVFYEAYIAGAKYKSTNTAWAYNLRVEIVKAVDSYRLSNRVPQM